MLVAAGLLSRQDLSSEQEFGDHVVKKALPQRGGVQTLRIAVQPAAPAGHGMCRCDPRAGQLGALGECVVGTLSIKRSAFNIYSNGKAVAPTTLSPPPLRTAPHAPAM